MRRASVPHIFTALLACLCALLWGPEGHASRGKAQAGNNSRGPAALEAGRGPHFDLPDVDEDPVAQAEARAAAARRAMAARAAKAAKRRRAKRKAQGRAATKKRSKQPSAKTGASKKNKVAKSSTKPKADKQRRCDTGVAPYEHVVEKGQHIGLIAGTYGVTSEDIAGWNPQLTNIDFIRPGQKLTICPEIPPRIRSEREIVVKPGQTLGGIALKEGLSVKALLAMQPVPIENPNMLRAGAKLVIVEERTVVGHGGGDGHLAADVEADLNARARDRQLAKNVAPASKGKRKRGRAAAKKKSGTKSHRHRGSKLASGRLLPKSRHYRVKRPANMWGTPATVRTVSRVVTRYHVAHGGPTVLLGDMSRRGGGPLRGHRSHQTGLDLDVGLVMRGKWRHAKDFVPATAKNLDVARTWALVYSFLRSGQVRYIFLDYSVQKLLYQYARRKGVPQSKLDQYFQYPRSKSRRHGIVRHWKGHRDHLHIRFRR